MKKEREGRTLSCMIVLSEVLSTRNAHADSCYLLQLSLDISFSLVRMHLTQHNFITAITKLLTKTSQVSSTESNCAATMQPYSLERGGDPKLYPKLYPVGYSFGMRLRLYWFVEGTMSSFSMKQSDYPTEIPGEV